MAAPAQDDRQSVTFARDHGPWTLEEWLDLPPGKPNIELVDGMLVVSPMEAYQNRRLQRLILRQLEDSAPADLEPMPDCNVALGGARALIPDFTVIDQPGFEGVILEARHHVLVGEIASPSTRLYDRTAKRALYAESDIPFLMFVDPGHPPEAVLFELRDGGYSQIARSVAGKLVMSRPFPVTLDLIDPQRQPGA